MADARIIHGDCLESMCGMGAASVDAIVTDPPYGLSFMGKHWDHGVPGVDFWIEALRVAKPGTHLLAFGGTRTYHRLACAIEDAGWEVRDCIAWVYGSGFPKSLDVSKAIDKRGGASVAWFGPWLRKWRQDNGVTQKQIAELFPSKTGGLTGCVANWELGLNMPTPEQFNLIRDTFNLPFCSIEEAEREVVGRGVSGIGTAFGDGEWARGGSQEFKITAPATDLARQWHGWGTALKPAFEPIIVARKPLIGTVAENVTAHGTGAMNVDGCRVGTDGGTRRDGKADKPNDAGWENMRGHGIATLAAGRWPANLIHDGSDEVVGLFPDGAKPRAERRGKKGGSGFGYFDDEKTANTNGVWPADAGGSAARFFYCAKASKRDREEGCESNHHPTVKPTALMRYLCRLVTPPGGIVLDPFAGSGSTGKGAVLEGFNFIGIELEAEYVNIARARIEHARTELQRTS